VSSLIRWGELPAAYYFFNILPTKNCKRAFEFVKVIIRNIVIFFHFEYNKNGIFDEVIITSTLHSGQ